MGLVSISKHPGTSCYGFVYGDWIAFGLFYTVGASPTWSGSEIFAGLHLVLITQFKLHLSLFPAVRGVVISKSVLFFGMGFAKVCNQIRRGALFSCLTEFIFERLC